MYRALLLKEDRTERIRIRIAILMSLQGIQSNSTLNTIPKS